MPRYRIRRRGNATAASLIYISRIFKWAVSSKLVTTDTVEFFEFNTLCTYFDARVMPYNKGYYKEQ